MPSRAKEIADAVAANLAAGFAAVELTPAAAPVSEWAPYRDDKQLDALAVICFPFQRDLALESRGSKRMDHRVGIFVAKARAANETNDTLAGYCVPLAEAIGARLLGMKLDGASCLAVAHDPLFDHERLRSSGIFEGIIALDFRESE